MTTIKWGIICSIPDKSPDSMDELREFGEWLTAELEEHSRKFYLHHFFEESPSFCFHCQPKDKAAIYSAYEKAHREFSNVLYVIHILPVRNSIEFTLMKEFLEFVIKELTLNYAIIGQGVLRETALSKFEGVELESALENMNQYIDRRLSQLITYQRTDNTFRLIVGAGDDNSRSKSEASFRPNDVYVGKCVEMVLHSGNEIFVGESRTMSPTSELVDGVDLLSVRDSSQTLIIEGFPETFNKFQVATLFSQPAFRPISVFITSGGRAFVDFTNKFHALQAALHCAKDAAGATANAELGVRLKLKCADPLVQKRFERRLAGKGCALSSGAVLPPVRPPKN